MVIITNTMESIIRLINIWKLYVSMEDIWPTSSARPRLGMTVYEPKDSTNTITAYTQNCMSGLLKARMRSALVKSRWTSAAAAPNFCFSYSSRT